jgi:hypothetical protein
VGDKNERRCKTVVGKHWQKKERKNTENDHEINCYDEAEVAL